MNNKDKNIKPHFKLLKVDETRDWSDDVVSKAVKLYGIYLVDTNEQTYCAELTPSYCAYFLYTIFDGDPDEWFDSVEEQLAEVVSDSDYGNTSYFHVNSVNKFAHDFGEHTDEFDDYDELVDDYLEDCGANHYV